MPVVDRRRFLVLAAGMVGMGATSTSLAGCTAGTRDPAPDPPGPAPVPRSPVADPDADLRAAVAVTEMALIGQYRRTIEAFPERAAELGALMVQHEEHLSRVAPEAVAPSQAPSPQPAESPQTAAGPEPDPSPVGSLAPSPASEPAPTLARLAAAETAARAEHINSCDAAADPALARDLCLMAASEAQHAVVLADLRRRGRDS
jgi:hypothetical protein